jgi:integrase
MLKQNIPAKVTSERLGHSTIGITLDLYSYVLREMQEEAAIKLEQILFKKQYKQAYMIVIWACLYW